MNINLKGTISLSDVAQWPINSGEITIQALRESQFEIGAEGVALGYIQSWLSIGTGIEVTSTFYPEPQNDFGSFGTLFGTYLAYASSKILDSAQKTDIKEITADALWQFISEKGGAHGNSKRRYIIFRDPDYLIPQCMQEQGNEDFPYADRFRDTLTEQTKYLGVDPTFGSLIIQRDIVTFLYQACRNSFEHGQPNSLTKSLIGIRGITIQKLIFATEEEVRRRPCSLPALREYLWQNWSDPNNKKKAFLSITIADIGNGIQNTLQPISGEDEWGRLNRAIFTSATRKPLSEEIERGKGLPYIVEAAKRLKAFLLVTSAGISGYADYSSALKYESLGPSLAKLEDFKFKNTSGTSLTFVWPVGQPGGEQLSFLDQ